MAGVVDLFVGAGGVLLLSSAFRTWVWHRRHERDHQENDRRLDQDDRVLAMIERAVFDQPEAVEPLTRLLSMSSLAARPVSHSLTSVDSPEESSPGNAA